RKTTGWAVDRDSPKEIAEAVNDIIAHPDAARRVAEEARRLAVSSYDWNSIARSMGEVFGRISA
ncbi:MAG TPA: glycosyltransferase, partial [Candidatus Paceibacterota bacterium]|nr:glycosyltransferase [Candidatus Paceibacterota bacterium]